MTIIGRVISKKNHKVGRGFFATSKRYKEFENDALMQLNAYRERYVGAIGIYLTFEMKGRLDTDLDNMVTSIIDVLQKKGIIDNDKNIKMITAVKQSGYKDWQTHITIKELK